MKSGTHSTHGHANTDKAAAGLKPSILIVEDDVMMKELYRAILGDRFIIRLVTSGEDAMSEVRGFTPDRNLAIGFEPRVDGFFWLIGQGGYGIQTSPATGKLVADLILGRDTGEVSRIVPAMDPKRFRPV